MSQLHLQRRTRRSASPFASRPDSMFLHRGRAHQSRRKTVDLAPHARWLILADLRLRRESPDPCCARKRIALRGVYKGGQNKQIIRPPLAPKVTRTGAFPLFTPTGTASAGVRACQWQPSSIGALEDSDRIGRSQRRDPAPACRRTEPGGV